MYLIEVTLEELHAKTTVRKLALLFAALVVATGSARAEVCVFPDYEEMCSGDECDLDFALDNSDTNQIQSDVLLGERRARASSSLKNPRV